MINTETLSPEHYDEIVNGSGVSPEVVDERGYRTLYGTQEDRDFLRELGYAPKHADRDDTYPALLIPLHGADGDVRTYQIKPAVPALGPLKPETGEPRQLKYVSPPRVPAVVDVPARTRAVLDDLSESLWITEGMKKVDALVSRGRAALGLLGVWNWRSKLGSLGDWEDIPLKGRDVVICFDSDAAENRHVQLAMARFGAWLKTKGATRVHYLVVPAAVDGSPVKGVDDFFVAGGTLAQLGEAASLTPPGGGPADASFSDAFLVEEVCSEALDGKFCWGSGLGWMKWDGRIWREVSDVEPVEAIRVWASERFAAVMADQHQDPNRDLRSQIAGWRAVLGRSRLRALMDLARGIVQRSADEFDADPDLLTVENGTLHLPTGRLLPFDATHAITRMAHAAYRPGASHPLWDKALKALPEDVLPWYRDRLGQALTGYKTPDHRMVLAYGSGSNGKSTIVNTVRKTLGDYGVLISDRVIMASPDAHPTELMDLRGARYAVMEETPEARHLNVQRLKTTVGTDSIKARRIRQDPVEFIATHSLFINSNYRPVVIETDHGTWRRLCLLTFPYTFRTPGKPLTGPWDRVGDPALEYAHQDPDVRSAALAWMAEGARAWYARGRVMLPEPDAVERDTREWRAETDLIVGFADECLSFDAEGFVRTQDMLSAFNEWSGERGHRPWNDKTFATRFGSHDLVAGARVVQKRKYVDGRQQRGWEGVVLGRPEQGPGSRGPQDPFDGGPTPQPELTPSALGFDLETASVDELYTGNHKGPFVRLVGSTGEHADTGTEVSGLIRDLNQADVIYGHNILRFDLPALARHHGADYDTLAAKAVDTYVLAQLVDPPGAKGQKPWSEKGYYGLDAVAQRLGHAGKSDDLSDLAEEFDGYDRIPVDEPRYREYLEGDLSATKHVFESLTAAGLSDYARREMRVAAVQNRMTLNGWGLNCELLTERVQHEDFQRQEAVSRLAAEFGMPTHKPDRFKLKPKEEWPTWHGEPVAGARELLKEDPEAAVSMGLAVRIPGEAYKAPWATAAGRAALIKAFAEAGAPHYPKTKTGELALGKDELSDGMWYDQNTGKARPGMLKVYGHIPAVRRLVGLIGQATGATSKYAEIAQYATAGGRVHPAVGATQASKRWATTRPATANISKSDLAVREVFDESDRGLVHLACDLSQVDVRAVAGHSQDPTLIGMLQPGRDFHTESALIFFGDASKRKLGKPISHGVNYGQGANAIAERNGLDVDMVRRALAARVEAMPRVEEWKAEVRELAASGRLLDNGFGCLMRCDPERAYTQAPALMGQGAARDIMCESLLRLTSMWPESTQWLRAVVHDEVVLCVPEEEAQLWADRLRQAFTWEWKGVPILCDVSPAGRTWADCYRGE